MVIYKITNLVNKKCYIGQTVQSPVRRWTEHRRDLRSGVHCNSHLQSAWDKTNESDWLFEIIDTAKSIDQLNKLEVKYINEYKSVINGYNLTYGGENKLASMATKQRIAKASSGRVFSRESKIKRAMTRRNGIAYPVLISPTGKEHNITTVKSFCTRYKLGITGIHDLIKGRHRIYKGWTVKDRIIETLSTGDLISKRLRGKDYPIVISPTKKEYTFTNMRQFCLSHQLQPTNFHKVLVGKAKSHLGWTLAKNNS